MVRDLRIYVETTDIDSVIDGDLNNFVEAYLRQVSKGESEIGSGKEEIFTLKFILVCDQDH